MNIIRKRSNESIAMYLSKVIERCHVRLADDWSDPCEMETYKDEYTETGDGAYTLIGLSGQTNAYDEVGFLVFYDPDTDSFRSKDYYHCSCNGTFDEYSDDATKHLCSARDAEAKLLANKDPRFEGGDRAINWQDHDAGALAVLLVHFARTNDTVKTYIKEKFLSDLNVFANNRY